MLLAAGCGSANQQSNNQSQQPVGQATTGSSPANQTAGDNEGAPTPKFVFSCNQALSPGDFNSITQQSGDFTWDEMGFKEGVICSGGKKIAVAMNIYLDTNVHYKVPSGV